MKFILANERVVDNCIKHIYNAYQSDKKYQVEIKEFSENRTLQQNRFLFGVFYKTIGDELGYSVEETHALFAKMFLTEEKEVLGQIVQITQSTTKLSKKEFSVYIDSIGRFVADYGIKTPSPVSFGLEYER